MAAVKFIDVKYKIIEAIKNRSVDKLGINESVTLFEGFINSPYQTTIESCDFLGGPFVPMVLLVGEETGRLYFFAYHALVK